MRGRTFFTPRNERNTVLIITSEGWALEWVSCNICSQLCAKSLLVLFPWSQSASFPSLSFHFIGRKFQFCPLAKFRTKFPSISATGAVLGVVNYLLSPSSLAFCVLDDKQFYKRKPWRCRPIGREKGHHLLVALSLQLFVWRNIIFAESMVSPRAPGIVLDENACIRPVIICGTKTLVNKTFLCYLLSWWFLAPRKRFSTQDNPTFFDTESFQDQRNCN